MMMVLVGLQIVREILGLYKDARDDDGMDDGEDDGAGK